MIVNNHQATVLAKDSKDNAIATATSTAKANSRHYITGVDASFSSSSVIALIQLKDGTTVIWEGYVQGTTNIDFIHPIEGSINTAFSATLAASGTAGQIGKVNLRGYLL